MHVMLKCCLMTPISETILVSAVHFRAHTLAEFLLDGDLQGPMRKTVAELENHDATNPLFLIQVTISCAGQLNDIFRKKEYPYFC